MIMLSMFQRFVLLSFILYILQGVHVLVDANHLRSSYELESKTSGNQQFIPYSSLAGNGPICIDASSGWMYYGSYGANVLYRRRKTILYYTVGI